LDRVAFTIFLFVLVVSVLLFGAVHTYAYTMVFFGILIAGILLLKKNITKDLRSGVFQYSFLKTSLNPLFFLLFGYLIFQTVPVPDFIIKFVSPEAWVVGKMSLPASSITVSDNQLNNWFAPSPYFYPIRQSIIQWTVYWLMFLGLVQVMDSRKKIELAVSVIIITGCFEALYGLFQAYSGYEHIWWFIKISSRRAVSGTYINRNHFAGLMELTLLLAAAQAAAILAKRGKTKSISGLRTTLRSKISIYLSREQRFNQKIFFLFTGAVMGTGLFLSTSRGGIIAAAVALLCMSLMFIVRKNHRRKGFVVLLLFLVVAVYAANIGVDRTVRRFEYISPAFEKRTIKVKKTIDIFQDYRLMGFGVGNFQYAFPKYQAAQDKKLFIRHAHNDWVQFMGEAGTIGLLLLLGGIFYYVFRIMTFWKRRNDSFAICLVTAPLSAMVAMAIHSYSDFNLHIPANFMMLTAVVAIGHAALHLEGRLNAERMLYRYHVFQFNLKGVLILPAFLGLILWSGIWTVRHFVAEVYCNTVPNSTMNRDPHPSLAEIRKAIWWDGHNAEYRYKLARELIRIRNTEFGNWNLELGNNQKQKQWQMDIIRALEEAVRLNPFNSEYHLRLGWEYTYLWQEPDYRKKWLPAADISMERAAYFAGESRPDLHEQLGNFWVMRSKTMNPADPGWEPAWIKACWHYKKALSLETGNERSKMNARIKKYVWNYYPDEWFVDQAVGTAN
jgi:O-antigen ligase